MKIGLSINGKTIYRIFESKPGPGDHVQIPAASIIDGAGEGEADVRIESLPTIWKTDDDGLLVPVMEAVIVTTSQKTG